MTKEFALNYYGEECKKSGDLVEMEKQNIIRNMESMLEEIKDEGYVNSYKWDKICKSYAEYQNYRKQAQENITLYNIIKTLED